MISYLTVFYPLFLLVMLCLQLVTWTCVENTEINKMNLLFDGLSLILVASLMSVNFFESFVLRHPWVMVLTSVLSVLAVVFCDLMQNTYHYYISHWPLNTTFDVFVLCMIYMFLPIPSIRGAALLATSVSLIYVAYFMHFLAFTSKRFLRRVYGIDVVSVDIFQYLGFNMMGIFFRIMNDTMVRASFLDRHQFMKEERWLRHALGQESMLLDSVLPPQIAKPIQSSIKHRIMQPENEFERKSLGVSSAEYFMAIQIHPDVSILYADVVNYTHLTTTLAVDKLVKVLHDLYGRFDMAASHFKVQRIKFLGDCYYCVAGLVEADPDHATKAVSLGISMIANIQEVRIERALKSTCA
ncbi:adenylyl cyclase X E-like [Drosophila ficusphila]|uniref:adenylyl cyclase X E-like n=1 Tax=Drosophila ficusphila TaxID=30025 RepID=UPI001C8AA7D7|nr:adenylyl cyclase X E-like [Drosophila ficusphila]